MRKGTRRFVDAPDSERCMFTIPWGKGERARCGRYRKLGQYCKQHAKIEEAKRHQRVLDDFGTQG